MDLVDDEDVGRPDAALNAIILGHNPAARGQRNLALDDVISFAAMLSRLRCSECAPIREGQLPSARAESRPTPESIYPDRPASHRHSLQEALGADRTRA